MKDFWTALALVLVVEGVVYALFPGQMKRALAGLQTQTPLTLRVMGVVALALGVFGVWVIRVWAARH